MQVEMSDNEFNGLVWHVVTQQHLTRYPALGQAQCHAERREGVVKTEKCTVLFLSFAKNVIIKIHKE